jgi:hypothetical protein
MVQKVTRDRRATGFNRLAHEDRDVHRILKRHLTDALDRVTTPKCREIIGRRKRDIVARLEYPALGHDIQHQAMHATTFGVFDQQRLVDNPCRQRHLVERVLSGHLFASPYVPEAGSMNTGLSPARHRF